MDNFFSEAMAFLAIPLALEFLLLLMLLTCVVFMAPPPAKRARKVLTLAMKQEILQRLDEGWSFKRLVEHYSIPRSTMSDLKKNRHKLQAYSIEYSTSTKTGKGSSRKVMFT